MKIQSYEFGKIVIDNKTYTSDVIIYPDRVESSWWRKEGHQLCIDDIKEVLEFNPEIIVVGTGVYGIMKVLPETEKYLRDKNMELIVFKTNNAWNKFNELLNMNKKVVACLHLTC